MPDYRQNQSQSPEPLDPRYEALPESIKAIYTPREYAWLGADGQAHIEQTETEPDHEP